MSISLSALLDRYDLREEVLEEVREEVREEAREEFFEEGIQIGEKRGEKRGIKKGEERGIKKGEHKRSLEFAQSLIETVPGFDDATIANMTKLSLKEVQRIRREVKSF